jgi:DNA-binding response OmpR family regulator
MTLIEVSGRQSNNEVHLLVVDDEPHTRFVLMQVLSMMGYHVEEATSGEEAIVLLERSPYDIMIVDICMPFVDGIEVMQHASQLRPQLLIIVLTGNPTLESAITAIKFQVVDYLLKPVSIPEITSAVIQALQKRNTQKKQLAHMVSEALEEFHRREVAASVTETPASRPVLIVPPLQLDRANHSLSLVTEPAHAIPLTRGETTVLTNLMAHPSRPLSCQQLVQLSWDYATTEYEAESIIRPYISRLRHKIESNPKRPSLIQTVRSRGYMFVPSENGFIAKYSN